MKVQMLYSFLKTDIELIEQELANAVASNAALIQQASESLLKAGGKRIRPVFVLLGAKFGDYEIERVKNVAVALELIHMASLVHDDVIDDAELRRGKPTVKAKWDNRIAMYTGDYILATALEYITKVEDLSAHQILADTLVEVCVGEIEQIKDKYRFNQNLRCYLRRIKRKTALLIAASCQLGAIAAGADEKTHRQLYRFGYNVGMSYQIIDDILDFTGTEKQLGKPAGEDLRQGNVTLPVLFAREDPKIRKMLETVHEHMPKAELEGVVRLVKQSGAIEQSYAISNCYLGKALGTLEQLPDTRFKKMLADLARYMGKRKF
ncbi:heptaprenyl diphosphate synthase component II [Heyndrickxia coagulans]|uniref:Heptaprenyl diphosphate synthase component 2 n=2 Tax=Heyndrickxia coagulans TaxID=1398 RepID=A0A150KH72_HEYCO|nr:heptaprenyl diphosphate synthase component II [Heyndrickxia coagulans]AJH79279.1 heptaprenyl diphosphate synthase component II [Heyndrickxia coagulans DSM 1 = ATCC 7050]KYC71736.1 Heptaprenyl diphosphate synthase component II [Heyndrickxia coagulans]MCR2845516.1 heptaprenyl diphosphate synthase component II [Heyndrickxia coagulans]MDR4223441.1 heptaprenyl diphosphate synthase component II [Heyndrickxia coagulans DSM 1 = ATCC 7050]MED4404813.1 heptaprenyl diphosphate synthase component II [H